jgi:hypothetical protein
MNRDTKKLESASKGQCRPDKATTLCVAALLTTVSITALSSGCQMQKSAHAFQPEIPKTYDEHAMNSWNVPLAAAGVTPTHLSSSYHYSIPVRPLFKSYPVYHPGHEPADYWSWLKQQEPQIIWNDQAARPKLETEADWIKAGELVYEEPIEFTEAGDQPFVRDPEWYRSNAIPIAKDGTMPFFSYVVRTKGKIELGLTSCADCHTRVLPDGTVVKGTQGNYPLARLAGARLRAGNEAAAKAAAEGWYDYHGSPWLANDPNSRLKELSLAELAAAFEQIPPGVFPNHNGSIFSPVRTANLIGVKERLYLDSTGHMRNRGPGDLMRFSDFNQRGTIYAGFGVHQPQKIPKPEEQERYSDERLYALALYLYSLKPPPNPHRKDALAMQGEAVFQREGCAKCHLPPLYTNNKLTPVDGFVPPAEHPEKAHIMPRSVHTDPTLALKTRKGTGFYKVPSLLGLWYRGPFEHNGSCATLEDWFNPARTNDTYVPTGWKGPPGTKTRAVAGHEYGLDLSDDDRRALIAFLRML